MKSIVVTAMFGLIIAASLPNPALAGDHPPADFFPSRPPMCETHHTLIIRPVIKIHANCDR